MDLPPGRGLRAALGDLLGALLDLERRSQPALVAAAGAVREPLLRAILEDHGERTREQVERVLCARALIGREGYAPPSPVAVAACDALAAASARAGQDEVGDAEVIAAAHALEQVEVAMYVAASGWARRLGLAPVAETLASTLAEEEIAAARLAAFTEHLVVPT